MAVKTVGREERIAGVFSMFGQEPKKRGPAKAGDTVGLGRLESFKTGDTITADKSAPPLIVVPEPARPVYGLAITAAERKDEVKLTQSLNKIVEEDPSLSLALNQDIGEMVLWGQGEMHLRVALKRLARRFGVTAETRRRQIAYKETIRKGCEIRGRHKKQSGGHGQYGDVVVEIRPMPRGTGFVFNDQITGGVVPKQYIPSVEIGVRDYLSSGPLGFPVVDVGVTLFDGQFHSVDSSELAFKMATALALKEGLAKCDPVLLEPILAVEVSVPSEYTSKVLQLVSQKRGQILGYDAKDGWSGWDRISVHLPQAEIRDLIVSLRSLTQGTGFFEWRYDHLDPVPEKLAESVVAHRQEQLA
jgi:elongation factor G